MRKVLEKLGNVQLNLKAPKDKYNEHGRYKYRTAEGICEVVKPLLRDNMLVLTLKDDILNVGDRFYVKATATLTDLESGEAYSVDAYAREELERKGMAAAQITGASSSFARKYALNAMFLIDDTKGPDDSQYGAAGRNQNQPKNQTNRNNNQQTRTGTISKEQATDLYDVIRQLGYNVYDVLNSCGVQKLTQLQTRDYAMLMKQFKSQLGGDPC